MIFNNFTNNCYFKAFKEENVELQRLKQDSFFGYLI
jgi:hypothetical protein